MRFYFSCLLIASIGCSAQTVSTKDNIVIGERTVFISECIVGFNAKIVDFNGIKADAATICGCIADELIPNIKSTELRDALNNGTAIELFTSKDNWQILSQCALNNIIYVDTFELTNTGRTNEIKELEINLCSRNILNDPEIIDISEKEAKEYCACIMDNLYAKGYTYEDLSEADEKDGVIFNEVGLLCLNLIINHEETSNNRYDPNDIFGDNTISFVPVIKSPDNTYKVKIAFGKKVRYALFDTGASDLCITKDLERELISQGLINQNDYLGTKEYQLADNRIVVAQMVVLNGIKIGDYVLNNVVAAILEEGSVIVGLGLLNKFKNWSFNKVNLNLTLYK